MRKAEDLPDPIGLILMSFMTLDSMKMRNKRLSKAAGPTKREDECMHKKHAAKTKKVFRFLSSTSTT